MKLNIANKNEEVGHKGVTMRESLKPMLYKAAEKWIDITAKEYAPGMIGLLSLQGAMPYNEKGNPEFVVFDVSPRIPGCPCVGPTSPEMRRLSIKFGKTIEAPLDLCMIELKEALKEKRDLPHVDYYICSVCGNTVENNPPDKCLICNAPAKSFEKIN